MQVSVIVSPRVAAEALLVNLVTESGPRKKLVLKDMSEMQEHTILVLMQQ